MSRSRETSRGSARKQDLDQICVHTHTCVLDTVRDADWVETIYCRGNTRDCTHDLLRMSSVSGASVHTLPRNDLTFDSCLQDNRRCGFRTINDDATRIAWR